jgi:uncharacterized protein YdiU (UPF0061 family)
MLISHHFNFESTYLGLPEKFYSIIEFQGVSNPEWVLKNEKLKEELGIHGDFDSELLEILSGNKWNFTPYSQAYAGHQFGHFTMLGDGRASLLGEHLDANGNLFDIQLKGSGPTPYSRRGDGRATLRSMLKEYIFSEAIHHLGIPSSRSLAVVKTGEKVYREEIHEGAILTRVMKSHIRVGTFEFARYFGSVEDVEKLLDYSIQRIYPDLNHSENKALDFLDRVMKVQINLIVQWMRVGFIHGVMNTDNTSISGETFDYGPCAFMGIYNPGTVFSSIDRDGRYSFDNQPKILKWNLARLAETLLPLMDTNESIAIEIATQKINEFDAYFTNAWYKMMFSKLGIKNEKEGDSALVDEFLDFLHINKLDYTNSYTYLRQPEVFKNQLFSFPKEMDNWINKWKKRIEEEEHPFEMMKKNNPVIVPKNYFVELALQAAEEGKMKETLNLIQAIQDPLRISVKEHKYLCAPADFDQSFQTFCGT